MAAAKKPKARKPKAKTPVQKKPRQSPALKPPENDQSPVENDQPPVENDQSPVENDQSAEGSVGESGQPAEGLSEYSPRHRPLAASKLDQHAEHAKREAERDAEREEHNQRTGDVSRQGWNH